jgi:hypothetical protein
MWMLCVALLLASVPALSCCTATAPAHDCCPQNQAPVKHEKGLFAGRVAVIETHCAAAFPNTFALAISLPDIRRNSQVLQPLGPVAELHLLRIGGPAQSMTPGLTTAAYLPSHSLLYLSTGRLRL